MLKNQLHILLRSASCATLIAFFTPIFSTISSVLRIPAVSIIFKVISFNCIVSSRVSLVVPAISVTIALSSLTKIFKRLDLPALGFPNITVLIPSVINLPFLELEINFSKSSQYLSSFT